MPDATPAPLVLREDMHGWCRLTLNRPDKLNALTVGVFRELRAHVAALRDDDTIACVVLRGAGRCFSAGHDLADIATGEEVPSRGWHSETLRLMEKLPMPVIAAVHGHCYTGALEVALACDFIVAADNARFGDTHAKWALTPIWGMSQRLPRRVGVATAKRLMFTADMIDAAEALRIGLAESVIPLDRFDAEVAALAGRIAANSRFSHAANKRLLDATDGGALDAGLQWEVMENEGVGPDMRARIAAFTDKKA
ncbi:enoyl-CoA hydratase/isomerase family protein [Sphingomonas adhaesiva]|uniref:enoyl-CoA hydratase/isomerase family protein n=1 Tax=Sphingomonas adhaesiva TaxID=28212 RepID=UPI002FF6012A